MALRYRSKSEKPLKLISFEDMMAETEERRKRHAARPLPLRLIIETWFAISRWRPLQPRPWERIYWRWQRSRRGWADRDISNLDDYLASVISGSIDHLRQNFHGYPPDMTPEVWEDTLRRISEPLALDMWRHDDDKSAKESLEHMQREREAQKEAIRLLAEHWDNIWD